MSQYTLRNDVHEIRYVYYIKYKPGAPSDFKWHAVLAGELNFGESTTIEIEPNKIVQIRVLANKTPPDSMDIKWSSTVAYGGPDSTASINF